jgi:putative peptidoglycan lipid II flippase
LRYAVLRVLLTTGLGYLCAIPLPKWLGIDPRWGAAGLTASAGVAGWVEFALLRRTLNARIGNTGVPASLLARLWGSSAIGATAGWLLKPAAVPHGTLVAAIVVLGAYGLLYFAATYIMRVEECAGTIRRILRRF